MIMKFQDFFGNDFDRKSSRLMEGSHNAWNSNFNYTAKITNIFVPKIDYYLKLNENDNNEFIPRFKLNNIEILKDVPINEPLRFTPELMSKAIQYGMIMLVNYKGADDKVLTGHERVIYPMVLGKSSKGKILLRGFHLKGWSVSANRDTEKVWRLFRTDRILNVIFTGSFFRLAPNGYSMLDKAMKQGIIAKADFGIIRRNQNGLLKANKIQNKNDAYLDGSINNIELIATNTKLDILNPFDNKFLNYKQADYVSMTFMKSIFNEDLIAVLGLSSEKPGTTVKCYIGQNLLGTYRTVSTVSGKQLKSFKVKNIKGQQEFDLFLFKKKK